MFLLMVRVFWFFCFTILVLMVLQAMGQSNVAKNTSCGHVPWTVKRIVEGENVTITWKRNTLDSTRKFRGYRIFHFSELIGVMERPSTCISCDPTWKTHLKKFCLEAKFFCNSTHISMEIPPQRKDHVNYTDCYTLKHLFSWYKNDVSDKRRLRVTIEKVVGLTVNISSPSDQNTPPTVVGSTLSISSQSDQNTPPTGTDVSDNQAVTIVVSIIAVLAAIIGIIGCVVRLYQKWHQNGDTGPDESSSDIFIAGNP
ncbi:uncharacterized protein LOC111328828 isoform X2 [Stylophora pistillata]|uniref:uncharacterized protein LOC111328828 isoform X2 n=1 Tax=Stylophora pistillata TaxID=50429 RepID=UPI000C04D188|nr:uncharacterized protein LOC111328828 isoform X2 [Stylophora pistillata]